MGKHPACQIEILFRKLEAYATAEAYATLEGFCHAESLRHGAIEKYF